MRASAVSDSQTIYRRLKRWFGLHARPFPWRGVDDPYRIWVSEIMLVQTTAAVAVKRYPRFLRRFPSLTTLAGASLDEVLKEWEGLGYYHRARYLHQAARMIKAKYGGRFPSTYDDIRALPGVGDYVAAAIANFSFGARIPAIDANVARVVARLFAIPGDVRSLQVRKTARSRLQTLMSAGRGSLWTDALIEIGATLCASRKTSCAACPLQHECRAEKSGDPMRYGRPRSRPRTREVAVACGVIRRTDGRILIAQRPETGLLPGLWEFPGGKRIGNESLAATCRREIEEELAITVAVGKMRTMIRHAYTHYRVRLHVFDCEFTGGVPRAVGCQRFRWVSAKGLSRYAFPAANQEIIAGIQADWPHHPYRRARRS